MPDTYLSLRLAPWRRRAQTLLLAMFAAGCASVYAPQNESLQVLDKKHGHRAMASLEQRGEITVYLAFSGGGTRAAALSYGVLQELATTTIGGKRLLDEVDLISSVSGGSFTAAYYGLYGDRIFENYEDVFLRQSVQSTLLKRFLSPAHWYQSLFSGFDRTEMAVEYYDRTVFKGKTFADMRPRPFILINATDIGTGSRFPFVQEVFDLICSDLDQLPVARAVTASSAVPVLFPSVVLKNHAGECDASKSTSLSIINSYREAVAKDETLYDPRKQSLVDWMASYLDRQQRPYVHLVDGGVSDNLGLRALLDRIELLGNVEYTGSKAARHTVIITVDAEVQPKRPIDSTATKPSMTTVVEAVSSLQISRYTDETMALVHETFDKLQQQSERRGEPHSFHLINVNFSDARHDRVRDYFNSLPTSLELKKSEIDALIFSGRTLLRQSGEFQAFLKADDVRGVSPTTTKLGDVSCKNDNALGCIADQLGEKADGEDSAGD